MRFSGPVTVWSAEASAMVMNHYLRREAVMRREEDGRNPGRCTPSTSDSRDEAVSEPRSVAHPSHEGSSVRTAALSPLQRKMLLQVLEHSRGN